MIDPTDPAPSIGDIHTPAADSPGGLRLRPYPFEVVMLVGGAISYLLLRRSGMQFSLSMVEFTATAVAPRLALMLGFGVLLQLVYHLLTSKSPLGYLRCVLRPGWLLLWVRLFLATIVLVHSYMWLKVMIPMVNPRLWDAELWRIDILLHGGISPNLFMLGLLGGTPLVGWIDYWYGHWLIVSQGGLGLLAALPGSLDRRRVVMAHLILWFLGLWIYVAVPAVGPAYYRSGEWSTMLEEMPRAIHQQHVLWETYSAVEEARTTGVIRAGFDPSHGVAAMPSLHVGLHWLLTLLSRRYARPLTAFFGLSTFVTLLGSVLTGWHYAIDAYVGLLVAQLAYWLALRLEKPDHPGHALG